MTMILQRAADRLGQADARMLGLLAVAVAFLARLLVVFHFGNFNLATAQPWEYGQEGLCAYLTHGDLCRPYHYVATYPSAYMPPSAPYIWLGLFNLFGATSGAYVAFTGLSLAAGVASVWLLFDLGLKLTRSAWAAFFAAMLLALYPTFLYVTAIYHTTNLSVALHLALIWLLWKIAMGDVRWAVLVGAGVMAALNALTRNEMLVMAPALICLAAAWRWPRRGEIARILLVSGAVMALCMTPWIARNAYVFGRFIPTAQASGYNLWKGFSRQADGSGNSIETRPDSYRTAGDIRSSVAFGPDYEHRVDQAFLKATLTDLKSTSPARYAKLAITKTLMYLLFDWKDPISHRVGYWGPWILANLLAVVGMISAASGRRRLDPVMLSLFGASMALLTATYAMTDVQSRYRMHLEPFLFVFSALGVLVLLAWARRPSRLAGGAPTPVPAGREP